ncbi:shikimate kinase [Azorhizobium oxalatiphilum]|uniref:Shikimate kinase n=1 Tax=Azorhizobium oxalatiphilum TaxID=980631 RepID=A0A917C791_9HYPH|nr:shikimate kinase [Azorhizobium oxalatiphilum]GGF75521.1 shikimate kinase [Azorhizobium oxalatiphilum]
MGAQSGRGKAEGGGTSAPESLLLERLGTRCIVLVGMPGAGKSSVGRRLAKRLGLPFMDADEEIERAAGMSIPEIFASRGEVEFRDGEKRVMIRLLQGGPIVLATGGGAFMNADTRAAVARLGVSVWLSADLGVLLRRVRKRTDRPLLAEGDPAEKLARLLAARGDTYALADLTVESRDATHEAVVDDVLAALGTHFQRKAEGQASPAPSSAP